MAYKYHKGQLFGKKLDVPKEILTKVYNKTLTLSEYFKYNLDDKIPTSCIYSRQKLILDKFGIEKCKNIDEFVADFIAGYNYKLGLDDVPNDVDDINTYVYEKLKYIIHPEVWPPIMRELYFDISKVDSKTGELMSKYYTNELSLTEILDNYNLFKDKDLNRKVATPNGSEIDLSNDMVNKFMSDYGILYPVIKNFCGYGYRYCPFNSIGDCIKSLTIEGNAKNTLVEELINGILSMSFSNSGKLENGYQITDEQYQEIFKYASLEDYLEKYSSYYANDVAKEYESLPSEYTMTLPISKLFNANTLKFAGIYGLKNIIDFDNECGHFFSANDYENLRQMCQVYVNNSIHNTGNESIFTGRAGTYTKEQFYEAMRRMLLYGIIINTDGLDYRNITGEFREKNEDLLFIPDQVSEEVKAKFYTRSITPGILREHLEDMRYLNWEKLIMSLKFIPIYVRNSYDEYPQIENIYKLFQGKTSSNDAIDFIMEYGDAIDLIHKSAEKIEILASDSGDKIKDVINELLRKIIVEKQIAYPKYISKDFIKRYPSMFLDKNVPLELQEAVYNRTVTSELILSNPTYMEYLKNADLEVLFRYMPVASENNPSDKINLVSGVKQVLSPEDAFNVMILYGKYMEKVFENNRLKNFKFNPSFSKDGLLSEMDKTIFQDIIDGNMKYDESMHDHFKHKYPTLFLNANVSQEIKNKFYDRKFTIQDFNDNPELLNTFGETNIACGFSENMSWVIPLFGNSDNLRVSNYNRMKIIAVYSKISDHDMKKIFKDYVIEEDEKINMENIDLAPDLLARLSYSNSSEIRSLKKELATELLRCDDPFDSLDKIERIFIKNNLPTVGKIYSCFEALHPNFKGFEGCETISPVLQNSSLNGKKMTVFADLIKAEFGSNNRSINNYLKNLEFGSTTYENIKAGNLNLDALNEDEKRELKVFSKHLMTMYNVSTKAKQANDVYECTGDVLNDILELSKKLSPDGSLDYNLADRMVRMFCGFTGIDTLDKAKEYINNAIKKAEDRNIATASSTVTVHKGDFVKGIGDITYLGNILQNGSVSKEYLGSSAGSDATPLDTDISMVPNDESKIEKAIAPTVAYRDKYGPIYFILKNDNRFVTTRTEAGPIDAKRDMSKLEVFYTGYLGEGHYGIRTGFASSDIDCIVMEKYDHRVGLEIAMNGFYIPVADMNGKITFTPSDYKDLRNKMSGLSYFNLNEYNISNNLRNPDIEQMKNEVLANIEMTNSDNESVKKLIKDAIVAIGIKHVTYGFNEDLSNGSFELYSTGSTARNTNVPKDSDFDYLIKIDNDIYRNDSKLNEFKSLFKDKLGFNDGPNGKICGEISKNDGTKLDVEISLCPKSDKIDFSTDVSLTSKLDAIKKQYPNDYNDVVANIVFAKKFFKSIDAYKSLKSDKTQGGLGGIGIENWILQHGGSFTDAAKDFVKTADEVSGDFEKFKQIYHVYDFGYNHYSDKEDSNMYPHDDFVSGNDKMGADAFKRMHSHLREYLKTIEASYNNSYNDVEHMKR